MGPVAAAAGLVAMAGAHLVSVGRVRACICIALTCHLASVCCVHRGPGDLNSASGHALPAPACPQLLITQWAGWNGFMHCGCCQATHTAHPATVCAGLG